MNLLNNCLNDKYKMFWLKLILLKLGVFFIIFLLLLGKWLTS